MTLVFAGDFAKSPPPAGAHVLAIVNRERCRYVRTSYGEVEYSEPIEGLSFALGVTVLLVACVIEAVRQEPSAAQGVG